MPNWIMPPAFICTKSFGRITVLFSTTDIMLDLFFHTVSRHCRELARAPRRPMCFVTRVGCARDGGLPGAVM